MLLFRAQMALTGIRLGGGIFPVQTLPAMDAARVAALHTELARRDVQAVAQRLTRGRARLAFLLGARHTRSDVLTAAATVAELLAAEAVAA